MTDFEERRRQLEKEMEELRAAEAKYFRDWDLAIADNIQFDQSKIQLTFTLYDVNGQVLSFRFNKEISQEIQDDLKSNYHAYCSYGYVTLTSLVYNKFVSKYNVVIPSDELKGRVTKLLMTPRFMIKLWHNKKYIHISKAPFQDSTILRRIPGHRFINGDDYQIPVSEGWRLYQEIEKLIADWPTDYELVHWEEDALELIMKDINRRTQLDAIALMPECDYDPHFPTNEKLRPFQTTDAMFAKIGKRVIIGEPTGLGKTPISIAGAWEDKDLTLVVCPAALRENWARNWFKFTGTHATVLRGENPHPLVMQELIAAKSKMNGVAKCYIVSYDSVSTKIEQKPEKIGEAPKVFWPWVLILNATGFDRLILDEGHYIKNLDSLRSKASRLLNPAKFAALTATPLINRPAEAYPLLHMCDPELFNNFEGFALQYIGGDGKTVRQPEEFKKLLQPYMIRHKRSDVQKDLPPINRVDESVELSGAAYERYRTALAGVFEIINKLTKDKIGETDIPSILAQIMRLKQICADDKIDRAVELAQEYHDNNDEKVIIFSQFVEVVRTIRYKLGPTALCITGETPQDSRMEIMDRFQNDNNYKYICLTSQVAREGLDLDRASAVIFVDPLWAPAYHEQCEGRAYGRLSNAHSIDSFYLNAANPDGTENIEDWIAELRNQKFNLIAGSVDDVDSVRDVNVGKELIKRIKDQMWKSAWR